MENQPAPAADKFSAAFLSVALYLFLMGLVRGLPSFGLLLSGRNTAGALGGFIGSFVGIVGVFLIFAVIFRFAHRGGRLNWRSCCKRATWVAFGYLVLLYLLELGKQ